MRRLFFLCFLFFITSITDVSAVSYRQQTDIVSINVIPEYETITNNTTSLSVITEIDIKPQWHLYWDNPGDTGDPTTLTFFETPYYKEVSSQHSSPKKSIFEEIITSYIYTKKIYFRTTFEITDTQTVTKLPFHLVLSYTACQESCFPETISLDFTLPIQKYAKKNPAYARANLNAEYTFPAQIIANASVHQNLLELKIEDSILQNCTEPEFVSQHPKASILADLPKTQVTKPGVLDVAFQDNELPPDFTGILLCPEQVYAINPLNNETLPSLPSADNFIYYLFTAFIAGLILNLMPCVLPILSLKALYLIQKFQRSSILSALSYLFGVVCSFIALSGILFYLRTIGEGMGWGFQLQSPLFNTFLLLLFFIIFLNLIDKLPLPDKCADYLSKIAGDKSFLTGFFAVIIACPCTGPFMGATLGYAITQPAPIYFGIFIALSLGYALPYTLIELFPHFFLKFIPKPGAWMITLKRVLALPIALTCLWLGWVIFNQLKPSNLIQQDIQWENYSAEIVEQAVSNNEPIFINFTAKWCLVCLVNDKTTLSTKDFKNLVQKHHIRLFKADWTNRDNTIREALQKYNRNSIPLYVFYPAKNNGLPIILPQILTIEGIRNSFTQ